MQLHYSAVGKVSDAFEIGDEFQAGQQLAGLHLANPSDSAGESLVYFSLDLVQLFFAIFDGQKSHA